MSKKKMSQLKKIDILSFGKVFGLLNAAFGVVIGGFMSLFSLLATLFGPGAGVETLFGLSGVIFLPLFYGVVGFLSGLLIAAVYNMIAAQWGGVKFELE